ncbi:15936_t:CDS:2, partial [Racocetra persica]
EFPWNKLDYLISVMNNKAMNRLEGLIFALNRVIILTLVIYPAILSGYLISTNSNITKIVFAICILSLSRLIEHFVDQVGIKNKEVINSVKNSLENQAKVISVEINETKDVVNALTRQIKILQEEIKELQEEIRKLQENQREPQEELKIAATLKEIIKRLETVVEALREIVKRLEMIVEAQENKKN